MRTHAEIIQKHAHMIQNVIEIGSFPVYRQSRTSGHRKVILLPEVRAVDGLVEGECGWYLVFGRNTCDRGYKQQEKNCSETAHSSP